MRNKKNTLIRFLARGTILAVFLALLIVAGNSGAYYNLGGFWKFGGLVVSTTAGPATLSTGICSASAYTVTTKFASGASYKTPSNLTVTLTTSTGTKFYAAADTTCTGAAITTVTISSGTSTASFYAKTNLAQTINIGGTATAYSSTPLSVTSSWNPTRIDLVAGTTMGVGTADGNGTAARLNTPYAVALGAANILYISDTGNCTIRKVNMASSNATTTIVGTPGTCGTADGSGTGQTGPNATLKDVRGITYDGTRYLYGVDHSNCFIRKIDTVSPYTTTTVVSGGCNNATVGNGTATGSYFSEPQSILYYNNKLYITGGDDRSQSDETIRVIDLSLAPSSSSFVQTMAGTFMWGGTTDGNGTAAKFHGPNQLATDGTYLYVADFGNAQLRKVTLASPYTVSTVSTGTHFVNTITLSGSTVYMQHFGSFWSMTTAGASLTGMVSNSFYGYKYEGDYDSSGLYSKLNTGYDGAGIANDGTYLYVPDVHNHAIKKVLMASPYTVTTIVGNGNKGANITNNADGTLARFREIQTVATDGNALYLAEGNTSNVIRKYDIATGAVTTLAGVAGTAGCTDGAVGTGQFFSVFAMAYHANTGKLFVWDEDCGFIRTVDTTTGVITTLASTSGIAPYNYNLAIYGNTLFFGPRYSGGMIYTIDLTNAAYPAVHYAGAGSYGDGTGPALTAAIDQPEALLADATNLYIHQYGRIKKIDYTATSTVSNVAFDGWWTYDPVTNATGVSATRYGAAGFGGMDADSTYLYILDLDGLAIRKVNKSTGAVTSFIGDGTTLSRITSRIAQKEQDGVFSTTSAISLTEGTRTLTYTPHGIFLTTHHGVRWIH